ncbi:hypothetical protein INT47_009291 [Mucor saturninus]|uniref:C2H2-type domain-containing protein n=1 Tax=Mucor saturninus TaxID=64648 RepID=A0A8H7UNW7_9FUNG|nr:hypothetical protein INT47_009291 [Mucor saturninus]
MQNQFKRMKLSNTYECDQCIRKFDTGVQLRNHKRIHAGIIEISTVSDNMETTRVLPTADAAPTVSFNPGEPRTFKASCNFGPDDEGHVYNEASIQDHAFTTSQMMSIQLFDIITSFQVFSECHRQIVHLMNTVIRDHDKLAEEYNPHIRHAGPVSTLLKEKTSIKAHEYDICSNVCQLFDITKDEKICSVCKADRYKSEVQGSPLVPEQTMKMMSVGDQLSKLLSHEETREKLRYRHDRKATPGIISDYFDGEDYKALKNANLFQSPDDIAIALFVDGFVNQKKSRQEMTIVHVLVMNFYPSIRYTDQYMFQLAIIPGKPKDLDSFLLPIIDEIKSLGEHGLIVERWNGETIKAKVHLVMATGDIPQVTKYMHHGGHMATYGCRICLVEGQKREYTGYGMYFQKRGASLRTVDHFVNGDEEHHIKNANLFSALPSFCGFITRKAGCMRSYSARSMERTIGKYSKLIKSKVHAGTNAGNMVERLSIRGYVNLALDTVSLLESITPIKTSLYDFIELPPTAIHNQNHQLWSPFITITTTSSNLVESVPINTFLRELKIYYGRSTRSLFASITIHNLTIKMAARALLFSNIITSRIHRRIRAEHRRGNHFVLFHANYKSKICWYVGSVNFYFEHNNSTDPNNNQFLVCVEVMKEHYAADYDNTIPMVKMYSDSESPRHAVINLNDIKYQVGLVQSSNNSLEHKVVAPYKIFNENVKQTAGQLKYI